MKQFSRETLETAKGLRLIDDALFRLISARKEVCQEILQTLLDDKDLVVLQATPQETITSLHREVTLDALCKLGCGKIVNIEVQKGDKTDDVRRCRFHLATITANKTSKGTDFKDIPDVTIVYITEYDALGNGKSVTCAQMCSEADDSYIPLNDGAMVYYANTACRDNTDKSELLNLFLERNTFQNDKFPNLSQAMKYFKENEKGVVEVCDLVEEYAKDYAKDFAEEQTKKQARDFALYLINDGKTDAEIISVTHLSEEEVKNLRAES